MYVYVKYLFSSRPSLIFCYYSPLIRTFFLCSDIACCLAYVMPTKCQTTLRRRGMTRKRKGAHDGGKKSTHGYRRDGGCVYIISGENCVGSRTLGKWRGNGCSSLLLPWRDATDTILPATKPPCWEGFARWPRSVTFPPSTCSALPHLIPAPHCLPVLLLFGSFLCLPEKAMACVSCIVAAMA